MLSELLDFLATLQEPVNKEDVHHHLLTYFQQPALDLTACVPSGAFKGTTLVWWSLYVCDEFAEPLQVLQQRIGQTNREFDINNSSPDGRNLAWLAAKLLLICDSSGMDFLIALKEQAAQLDMSIFPEGAHDSMNALSLVFAAESNGYAQAIDALKQLTCWQYPENIKADILKYGQRVPLIIAGLLAFRYHQFAILDLITSVYDKLPFDLQSSAQFSTGLRQFTLIKGRSVSVYSLLLETINELDYDYTLGTEELRYPWEMHNRYYQDIISWCLDHSLAEFLLPDTLNILTERIAEKFEHGSLSADTLINGLLSHLNCTTDVLAVSGTVKILLLVGIFNYASSLSASWVKSCHNLIEAEISLILPSLLNAEPLLYYIAKMYFAMGKNSEALSILHKVTPQDKNYSKAQYAIAVHYSMKSQQLGDQHFLIAMSYLLHSDQLLATFRCRLVMSYCGIPLAQQDSLVQRSPIFMFLPPQGMSIKRYLDIMQAQAKLVLDSASEEPQSEYRFTS